MRRRYEDQTAMALQGDNKRSGTPSICSTSGISTGLGTMEQENHQEEAIELQQIGGQDNRAFEPDTDEEVSDGEEKADTALQEDPDAREEDGTKKDVKKSWDPFRESKRDEQIYGCETCIEISKIILKIFFVVLSFSIILSCLVVSKLSILYVTSNLNPSYAFTTAYVVDECGLPVNNHNVTCGTPVCKNINETVQGKSTVRWIWCLVMCLTFPYFIIFLRSMRKILFKKRRSPTGHALTICLVTETLHTIGLMIFTFVVLPQLDVARGTLLMTGSVLVPALLKPFIDSKVETKDKTTTDGSTSDGTSKEDEKSSRHLVLVKLTDVVAILMQISAGFYFPAFSSITGYGPINPNLPTCIPHPAITSTLPSTTEPLVTTTLIKGMFNTTSYSFGDLINATSSLQTSSVESASYSNVNNVLTGEQNSQTTEVHSYDYTINLWLTPLAVILISISYWENFIDKHNNIGGLGEKLYAISKEIRRGRTKISAVTSFYKMVLTFGLVFPLYLFLYEDASAGDLFHSDNFKSRNCTGQLETATDWTVLWGIQAGVSLLAFLVSDTVVKAAVQVPTLTLATLLSTPLTLGIAYWGCIECTTSPWSYSSFFFWNCFSGYEGLSAMLEGDWLYLSIFWMISQWWITGYMWKPNITRMAKTDHIFIKTCYCGSFLEQSLMLNRRRNDADSFKDENNMKLPRFQTNTSVGRDTDPLLVRDNDDVPKLFLCATMWHETESEMVQILKSIFRLDDDHRRRRYAIYFLKIKNDPDFYQFETHIFFDDAFTKHGKDDENFEVNDYVKMFMKALLIAAFSYHGKQFDKLRSPIKYPTPYGGKLVYELPGGNSLNVHMKDKMKIRNRKRWSQVMYMRYLLGHRLWASTKSRRRKDKMANNTFILALDGDVDFKPEAVILLVDLMKRNSSVGAACGRIHPAGSGPMVWYQKFEYAISHWLQKATEHVLGCVLCSPGCFSLFRASAIMDDNVLQTYSKQAADAIEHVQYDQGEDRWLCTLMLQQGHRVEYSAAADAITNAPTGFNEFFNQRRRWTPSTMANIIDLLSTGTYTVSNNENISLLYIVYQAVLFAISIIGPGMIFLLIVGSLETSLMQEQFLASFFVVLIPLLLFFIIAMTQKSESQLALAAILSACTVVIQMIVIVSLLIVLTDSGLCDPATWMMFLVLGAFVLAAVIHPQEAMNILHLFIFFLLIPTMYLILIIYAVCNLHDISWGTREVIQSPEEKKQDEARAKQADQASQNKEEGSGGLLTQFTSFISSSDKDKHANMTCSLGPFCSLACCLSPGKSSVEEKLDRNANQNLLILEKLDGQNGDGPNVTTDGPVTKQKRTYFNGMGSSEADEPPPDYGDSDEEPCSPAHSAPAAVPVEPAQETEHESVRPPIDEPKWCKTIDGDMGELSVNEVAFWDGLIERYLFPIDLDIKKKELVESQLKDLRNKSVLAFFMINIIVVVFISTLQASDVNIAWNCTNPFSGEVSETRVEPIGLSFTIIFGSVIFLQVVGMLLHRLFSLIQIVSSTHVFGQIHTTKNASDVELSKLTARQAYNYVRQLDNLKADVHDDEKSLGETTSAGDWLETNSQWTDDNLYSAASLRPEGVTRKLARKQPVYTAQTLDRNFAKKFIALHRISEDNEEDNFRDEHPVDIEAGGTRSIRFRPNRRASVFNVFSQQGRNRPGSMQSDNRLSSAFNVDEEHVNRLQTRFNLGDDEIREQQERYHRHDPKLSVRIREKSRRRLP